MAPDRPVTPARSPPTIHTSDPWVQAPRRVPPARSVTGTDHAVAVTGGVSVSAGTSVSGATEVSAASRSHAESAARRRILTG